MVNIPTIYGDDWGMVYGLVIPTLYWYTRIILGLYMPNEIVHGDEAEIVHVLLIVGRLVAPRPGNAPRRQTDV